MGGNMSWPRFRGRNHLLFRPNYYTGAVRAPAAESGDPLASSYPNEVNVYLSGEIDRMVYGWWLSPELQEAIANDLGITVEQVDGVMRRMLTWDFTDGSPAGWIMGEVP